MICVSYVFYKYVRDVLCVYIWCVVCDMCVIFDMSGSNM